MYSRLSMVLMPILAIALLGAGFWGYQEHQDKIAILIKAENQYQRAFHDLSFHMDKLQTELGNTLTASSTSQDAYRKGLVNVWRLTSQAQNEINQLPLTLMPFNHTEEFLANMANFSYRTGVRDMSKQPLTEQEMKTLNELYSRAQNIKDQLRDVQSKVIANNLRWMDVETALATQKEQKDNTIIDGFQTVDKKLSEYSELDWGPSAAGMHDQKKRVKVLSGPSVTAEDVKKKAAEFVSGADTANMQVVENGKGTDFQSYTIRIPRGAGQNDVNLDFTKQGGQLISLQRPRDVPTARLDLRQARDIGAQFLDVHGFQNTTAVSYDQYDNVAVITYAGRQNGVIIYPEKVVVKVALDNGEVTGVQASDYVFQHKQRTIAAPKLSAEEARKTLNPAMKISKEQLAIVTNDLGEDVLCREFIGDFNGKTYRIYVNSDNGNEEKIETIQPNEKAAVGQI